MADRSNQRLQTLGIPQAPEADSVMRSRRADSPLGPGLMPNNRPDTCVQSTQSKIYGILQNRGRSYMKYASRTIQGTSYPSLIFPAVQIRQASTPESPTPLILLVIVCLPKTNLISR